jgi:hypothetical protein
MRLLSVCTSFSEEVRSQVKRTANRKATEQPSNRASKNDKTFFLVVVVVVVQSKPTSIASTIS